MVGQLLERLTAVIDELAAIDLDTLADAEIHDAVVGLGGLSSRLEAQWCRLIGRWDGRQIWAVNGSKAAGARLARESALASSGRRPSGAPRPRPRLGEPHTEQAYEAGQICGAHVDLVASCNREWRNAEFAASEELLVNLCRTQFFGVAARGIEYWKQCADRDAADRAADTVRASRHLSASVTWNGTVAIDGVLDPLGGEVVQDRTRPPGRTTAPAGSACRCCANGHPASRRRPGGDGDALRHRPCRRVATTSAAERDDRHRTVQPPLPNRRRYGHRPRAGDPVPVRRRHRTDRLRPAQPQHRGLTAHSLHRRAPADHRDPRQPLPAPVGLRRTRITLRRRPHRPPRSTAASLACATVSCCAPTTTAPSKPPTTGHSLATSGARHATLRTRAPTTTTTPTTATDHSSSHAPSRAPPVAG